MLAKATITKWDARDGRVDAAISGVFLINMSHVNGMQTRASSKSSFYYIDNLYDRREAPRYVECDSSVTTLTTAADATWQSNFINLPIFTDNVSTGTIYRRAVAVESIAFVWEDSTSVDSYSEAQRCWVTYTEGAFRTRTVLVDLDIDQLLEFADTGSTTT
jgi:hypothetical protein